MEKLQPPPASSRATRAVMRGNRRADTVPEVRIRSILHKRGLRFRKDYPIAISGRRVRSDIVFTRKRVAVFIDGCFWHSCPLHGVTPRTNAGYWKAKLDRNVKRDHAVNGALSAEGWTVLRIWEHVPADEAARGIVKRIQEAAQ